MSFPTRLSEDPERQNFCKRVEIFPYSTHFLYAYNII